DLPVYDAELALDGKAVGRVTSAAPDSAHGVVALAYIRREVPADAALDLAGRPVRQLAEGAQHELAATLTLRAPVAQGIERSPAEAEAARSNRAGRMGAGEPMVPPPTFFWIAHRSRARPLGRQSQPPAAVGAARVTGGSRPRCWGLVFS